MSIEGIRTRLNASCGLLMVFAWLTLILPAESASSIMPIGQLRSGRSVQGAPFDVKPKREGQTVRIQGLIHQTLLSPGSQPDRQNHAFLIQNLPSHADGNDKTSDGLLVYTGKPSIPWDDRRTAYLPKVGDWVVLEGRLQHRYGQTELGRPHLVHLLKEGVNPSSALPRAELTPDPVLSKTLQYMETLEGMRVVLPSNAVVVSGRKVIGNHTESYAWVLPASDPVANRVQAYQNRVFRDAHPLDDLPDTLFDNDNGARVLLGSHGIKGMTGRPDALLPALRVGDRLTGACVGGVIYSYGQYKIMPIHSPSFEQGMDPFKNVITEVFQQPSGKSVFRVATFNLENLYDHRDDPSDPCDAHGDPGNATIQPPFNYLPASERIYRNRLTGLARQIAWDLKGPGLILVQEFEDQDVLDFSEDDGDLTKAGADGLPDVLQELAKVIQSQGGPEYVAAQHRQGADARGISCGFLYRKDSVQLKPLGGNNSWLKHVRRSFPGVQLLGDAARAAPLSIQARRLKPDQDGALMYARPAQMARFQFVVESEIVVGEWVVVNAHFASRPNDRVALRRDQATLLAEIGKAWMKEYPESGMLIGGDLNVFPRPDDPFSEKPSDQLAALYKSGAQSVYDWIIKEKPENAYSYVYEGQAQTLDHVFLLGEAKNRFRNATFVHINADWPEGMPFSIDKPRGISDHDPLVVSFR